MGLRRYVAMPEIELEDVAAARGGPDVHVGEPALDREPVFGGHILDETVIRVSGPHPGFEQDGAAFCATVHDLIG